ncbi:MAG: TonB family protein [Xenococcaceae cyanobacterium MO_188.B32]|nr:TonB family protein [Xenococcaceae cyanobacterium MO_188.B32]
MMYNFVYSIQKRQQEQKQLQKLLIVSFVGSALLHGILIVFLLRWLPRQSPVKVKKPIEIILVEKPQPKPIETKVVPKPKPKPTPPPKVKKPEPLKPEPTPPPKAKTPEPPKPQITPPPKIEQPRRILTTSNTRATNSVFNPPAKTETPAITKTRSIPRPTPPTTEKTVATNSPPPATPKPTREALTISCVTNCQPKYPSALNGEEGRAGIRLTIDKNGNVIAAELVRAHSNTMLNRQALLAARRMKFNKINNEAGASVVVNISFTVKGSEFERIARERQAQQERERQAKLEAERRRQEQEAARQRQENTRQQQTPAPEPTIPNQPTEQERQAEMLRKFRERMNNYQQNR